jgi:glycosyltransferase involved in cell wall biosynthesis
MPTVLHVLPHPGGGGETYIDLLAGLDGYEHRRVHLSSTRSRLGGAAAVIGGRRKIKRLVRGADLVHLHGDMAAMLVAPAVDERPFVITTHGLHRLRRSRGMAGALVHRRLAKAIAASAVTICCAGEEREELLAILPGSLGSRLVVVNNGVPVPPPASAEERARARASLGLKGEEIVALFAGRLEPRKDPLGAVRAVEQARANGAELTLLLAGEGPLAAEVRSHEGPGVRPLGHRGDLGDLYGAADIFLLPSHREGMSLALLEAMAHGLVPVVADGAGNEEAVGKAGIVFPAGDLDAMSERLAGLAADAEARARLGAVARERVQTELSLDRFLAGTRAQYEVALGRAAPQGA